MNFPKHMVVSPAEDPSTLPKHVAIIMDGNGRWALERGLPRIRGHHAGAERLREIVEACPRIGLQFLTVFAFSTENWKRSTDEVGQLMGMFRRYILSEQDDLLKNGVRVRFIGDRTAIAPDLAKLMGEFERKTQYGNTLCLTIALNYGGRNEILHAAKKLAEEVLAGNIRPEEITDQVLTGLTYTNTLPDPDLLIRTSGETRISNFMLWQCAYSEIEFVDVLWPDFTPQHLESILTRFAEKERRFGATAG